MSEDNKKDSGWGAIIFGGIVALIGGIVGLVFGLKGDKKSTNPTPTPQPTPQPDPTPDPTPEPEPTPEPTPDPEPDPTPYPDVPPAGGYPATPLGDFIQGMNTQGGATYWISAYPFNNIMQCADQVNKRSTYMECLPCMSEGIYFDHLFIVADGPIKSASVKGTQATAVRINANKIRLDFQRSTSLRRGKHVYIRVDYDTPPDNLAILFDDKVPADGVNPHFAAAYKDVQIMRTMGILKVNGNHRITGWSNRRMTNDPWKGGRGTSAGISYEQACDLANASGSHLWINIHHGTGEDYIRKTMGVVKARLRPDLQVFVEYSNELWNTAGGFAVSTKWAEAEGRKLGEGGPKEAWNAGKALWSGKLFKIAREVMGTARVRNCLMTHMEDTDMRWGDIGYMLKMWKKYGNSEQVHYIGGAPYFGMNGIDRYEGNHASFRQAAQELGAEILHYEGGSQINDKNSLANLVETDSFKRVHKDAIDKMKSWGVKGIVWFSDFGPVQASDWVKSRNPRELSKFWELFKEVD